MLQAENEVAAALESLRNGDCVAILDSHSREAETDLFFPAISLSPVSLRTLRVAAGGELYISIAHHIAHTFGLPFIGQLLASSQLHSTYPLLRHLRKEGSAMCQGSCSVGISLDHRSLKTGAPDSERSFTCRRVAELWKEVEEKGEGEDKAQELFGREFHTPGHIFLCVEHPLGVSVRSGHTELSVALAREAGIPPVMVGCVMLSNEGEDYGALPEDAARAWAKRCGVPFVTGDEIVKALNAKIKLNNGCPVTH